MLLKALTELQLIDWIGTQVTDWIKGLEGDKKMAVAILLILWVSAIASSFIDNIPYTTAMVLLRNKNSHCSVVNYPMVQQNEIKSVFYITL